MSDESERLIATYFHKVRSEAKHKPSAGVDKIVEAMRGRIAREWRTNKPDANDA